MAASAQYAYQPSAENPFGKINPEAPERLADWAPLIGLCDCKSVSRIDQNTWADTVQMHWTFKYIMNGMAVQDDALKVDGSHGGSIRQYNADSSRWYVHYFSSGSATGPLSYWEGNKKEDGRIVLYKPQTAPNGWDGFYRIIFSEISNDGFNWEGSWVLPDESVVYPTWRIYCIKSEDDEL